MPSVIVSWKGRCLSRTKQSDLCGFISRLAEVSHGLYENPPEVKLFNKRIEGRILLSKSLLPKLPSDVLPSEVATIRATSLDFDLHEQFFGYSRANKMYGRSLILARSIQLHGIEFHLYDPRDSEDRVSFVFISHDTIPALNGKLVMVEDYNECQSYNYKEINQADWLLKTPDITLRYYLEEWFDVFLGWIKYFFIPDLYFWRYGDFPQYTELKEEWDKLAIVKSKTLLRNQLFDDLLKEFKSQAVLWKKYCEE